MNMVDDMFDIEKLNCNDDAIFQLAQFLQQVDKEFAVPLSKKIDFLTFSEKVLNNGYVFIARDINKMITGCVCGYANDKINNQAFESIFVTIPSVRGTGLAQKLFTIQINHCKNEGMKKILFSTNKNNTAARNFYKKNHIHIYDEDSDLLFYQIEL